jgi:hypothetical protein
MDLESSNNCKDRGKSEKVSGSKVEFESSLSAVNEVGKSLICLFVMPFVAPNVRYSKFGAKCGMFQRKRRFEAEPFKIKVFRFGKDVVRE